jgi:hypothetical protein
MKLSKISKPKSNKTKNMSLKFVYSFIFTLIQSVAISLLILTINVSQFSEILNLNIIFWFAFTLPIYVGRMIWMNSSFKLFLIDSVYHLINVFLISLVLFYF